MSLHAPSSPSADGALARGVRRAARAAARRPKTVIALWLLLVIGCGVAGGMAGTQTLTDIESGAGESKQADIRVRDAGLRDPAVESILVRSGDPAKTAAAAADLTKRLKAAGDSTGVQGPADSPALSKAGGEIVLVQARLRGDPDDAADRAESVTKTVAAASAGHAGVTFEQAGSGSFDVAINEVVADDLQRAEVVSLPITLIILVVAFGALVAASIPLVLGITSVAAAMGALGLVSQIAPSSETTASVVVLIGLAVGVDYSLFYIRREREERRAGRGPDAALDAAAASVGRAILVSGLTVMIALAGLLLSGNGVFVSIGLATMLVVAIAVLGSLTVLPALLALLGDRIDRGRLPRFLRRRPRPAGSGLWGRVATAVTRRPRAALVVAVALLASLAVPALGMKTGDAPVSSLPQDLEVVHAQQAIEQEFPGAPSAAQLVVSGDRLGAQRGELEALGGRAAKAVGGSSAVTVEVARDGRTAIVGVPMSAEGQEAQRHAVEVLRDEVAPTAPGTDALVTGEAARSADFAAQMRTATPVVIGFVMVLAFALLLWAFRSPKLAATVIGLNLLSVGAAFGLMAAVFQHTWAEDLLGFASSGAIVPWLPLFAFVVLFGLSMDYTVLVLERIREARRAGRSPAAAAAEGVGATAGTVTSAAIVMVAIFAVFATLRLLDMKQMGFGLAAAVLLDVTLVRGVALPAAIALLGDRGWRVRPRRRAARPVPVEVAA
jgi:RND superfamily putative drug exporter